MAINYIELLPEKFQKSQMLIDYLSAIGSQFDLMIDQTDGILELINPNTVPIGYIQKLADLLGLELYGVGTLPEYKIRNQLIQAVDWYRIKGTYQSLADIAYFFGFHLKIMDFWTNNYTAFTPEDWFVGNAGEVPSDLDSSYYKSPHFGLYFILDKCKNSTTNETLITQWDSATVMWDDSGWLWGGRKYLWDGSGIADFSTFLEKIRPVNTVPHVYTLLSPITKEDGIVQSIDVGFNSNISAVTTINWTYSTVLFDDSNLFDDSHLFDDSPTAFLASITNWKLGNGNKGKLPLHSATNLNSPIVGLVGTITQQVTTPTYTEFRITLPTNTVQSGVSELGLYLNDNTTLVALVTFPDIDIGTEAILQINVRIYRV